MLADLQLEGEFFLAGGGQDGDDGGGGMGNGHAAGAGEGREGGGAAGENGHANGEVRTVWAWKSGSHLGACAVYLCACVWVLVGVDAA